MANNTVSIIISAKDNASKVIRGVGAEMDKSSNNGDKLKSALTGAGRVAGGLFIAGTAAATTGLIAASKAAFDQVKAVEEAKYGLQAYEKDASKVEKVLSGLVDYAKSDMGVLFNRKDMFAAASTLKMYGNETDTLTDRVKILSKGVAMGKTTFQELSGIVGRAAAKAQLDASDFDMLIERGIGLDKKFRGAKVSAEELWSALNTALPDEILAGRAQTIEGRFVRLQSAFRNVGMEVLGVDAKTSQFIKGGLGDRFMAGVEGATGLLKSLTPVVREGAKSFLSMADTATGQLQPRLSGLGNAVMNQLLPALQRAASSPFAQWLGSTLVMAAQGALIGLQGLVTITSQFVGSVSQMTPLLILAATSMATYKVVTTGITVATGAATLAQNAFNLALKANPAGLVIAGIAGIVTAYIAAKNQADSNKGSTDRLADAKRQLREANDRAKESEDRLRDAFRSQEGAALAVERAQRTYNDAVKQYGPNSLEAREAAYNLKRANDDLATANRDVKDRTRENAAEQQKLSDKTKAVQEGEKQKQGALQRTGTEFQNNLNKVGSLNLELDRMNGRTITYNITGRVDNAEAARRAGYSSGAPFKNAIGTHYSRGGQTLVGEHGPELVNLPRGAQVKPNYQTRQETQQGGDNITNIYGSITIETPEAANAFWDRIDKTQRLAKAGMA